MISFAFAFASRISQVEVVVEEEMEETSAFDFNEDIDTVRAECVELDFNQTASTNAGTSLCFSQVSVSAVRRRRLVVVSAVACRWRRSV